jgi:hypothetical protein
LCLEFFADGEASASLAIRRYGLDDFAVAKLLWEDLVSAVKALASKVSETAHLIVGAISAKVATFGETHTDKLCVGDVCVTRDEFLRMTEAAGAPTYGALQRHAAHPRRPREATQTPPRLPYPQPS